VRGAKCNPHHPLAIGHEDEDNAKHKQYGARHYQQLGSALAYEIDAPDIREVDLPDTSSGQLTKIKRCVASGCNSHMREGCYEEPVFGLRALASKPRDSS
jgi:hypothetical protein